MTKAARPDGVWMLSQVSLPSKREWARAGLIEMWIPSCCSSASRKMEACADDLLLKKASPDGGRELVGEAWSSVAALRSIAWMDGWRELKDLVDEERASMASERRERSCLVSSFWVTSMAVEVVG